MHLSQAAVTGSTTGTGTCTCGGVDLARVENHRQGVTADQVRTWCANPDTQVVVKPVIDLNDHHGVEGYEIPDRLREQTSLRTGSCVFPWCTRPARTADCDHVIAYDQGGSHLLLQPRRPCADGTIASKPTPRGATRSWNPGRSCGPARTATSSSATTKAPSTSPPSGPHPDQDGTTCLADPPDQ